MEEVNRRRRTVLQVQVGELHLWHLSQSTSPRKCRFHLGFSLGWTRDSPSSRTAAYGCCTFSETDVVYVTSTPVWQTSSGLMRPLTPKRFTRLWAVSTGDVRPRCLQTGNQLHFNGTESGSNVQGHAPSNSDVGARPTNVAVVPEVLWGRIITVFCKSALAASGY